jgi:hypothetical protein
VKQLNYNLYYRRHRRRWEQLKWVFKKYDVGVWAGLSWLRIETGGRALVNAVMNIQVP